MTNVTLEIRVVPGDEDLSGENVINRKLQRKFQLDKKDLENALRTYGPISKIEIV